MTLPINPSINLLIKIAAAVQLALIILNLTTSAGYLSFSSFNGRGEYHGLLVYFIGCALPTLMAFYIYSLGVFFKERRMVVSALLIYAIYRSIFFAFPFTLGLPQKVSLLFSTGIGLLTIGINTYAFIISFFIRSRVLFSSIMLVTTTHFLITVLQLLTPIIFPTRFEILHGPFFERNVVDRLAYLGILIPIAMFLLATRVTKYFNAEGA